jgi:acetyl/propionyl-CoA carboxylase alpha subunit
VVKAFIVPKPGARVTAEEIIAWSRENMSTYKVPRTCASSTRCRPPARARCCGACSGPLFHKVLIANRGEIAVRIAARRARPGHRHGRGACRDDAGRCTRAADAAVALDATGPAAYLDIAALIAIARDTGCEAVHPGYGFLSERADFAQACADAGLVFIGPTPAQLALFGDKASARALASEQGVPLLPAPGGHAGGGAGLLGSAHATRLRRDAQGGGGGGGRGMRAVRTADLPAAFERCRSEALAAFGVDAVYVERLIDGMPATSRCRCSAMAAGAMSLGERECTLQRRFQKLVEIAPSPSLDPALRDR